MELVARPMLTGIGLENHGRILRPAAEPVSARHLGPHVSRILDFEQIPEAHRLQESGQVNG